jgi:hypothetical protein
LSLQLSTGHIHSPEQLHPDDDEQRTTTSASLNLPLADGVNWASTIAWGLKDTHDHRLHAWLGETALKVRRHTLFARAERVEEAELFESGSLASDVFPVSKFSLGYAYELPLGTGPFRIALGALASAYAYPDRLRVAYGGEGVKSAMLFARIRLAGDARD